MSELKVSIRVTFAWWLKPYLRVLAVCCVLAGRLPDQAKLEAKVQRATRISLR